MSSPERWDRETTRQLGRCCPAFSSASVVAAADPQGLREKGAAKPLPQTSQHHVTSGKPPTGPRNPRVDIVSRVKRPNLPLLASPLHTDSVAEEYVSRGRTVGARRLADFSRGGSAIPDNSLTQVVPIQFVRSICAPRSYSVILHEQIEVSLLYRIQPMINFYWKYSGGGLQWETYMVNYSAGVGNKSRIK